jgi:hypothetical protein
MTALAHLFSKHESPSAERKLFLKPGHEFWRMKRYASHAKLTQVQFNTYMATPEFFHPEDPVTHKWRKEQADKRRKGATFNDNDLIHLAVAGRRLDEIKRLLGGGRRCDVIDREGRTPLFYAAMDGDTEIVAELLRAGAEVNARDFMGETPLHFAAREDHAEIVEFLLTEGASVNAQDIDGNTPLLTCTCDKHGTGRTAKLLIDSGADRFKKNHHHVSPADLTKQALQW